MAALLVCLPAMQAFAQTYDAGWMDPAPILFPGDILENIAVPVTLDGEALALGEEIPTAWTNDSEEGKVYRGATAEDGSVALTLAGYELTVVGGTSKQADETADPVGGHYVPAADEIVDETAPKKDRAYYPAYTEIKIKADEPEEGMEFDKWTVEPEDFVLTDPLSAETTVTTPEKKVTVTANYRPVQAENPVDPGMEGAVDPNTGAADPGMEGAVDPNTGAADPGMEGMVDPNMGVADPNMEGAADPNMGAADPNMEGAVDPNMGMTDSNMEGASDPDVVVVPDGSADAGLDIDLSTGVAPEYDTMLGGGNGSDMEMVAPADSIFDGSGDDQAIVVTTDDEYNSGAGENNLDENNSDGNISDEAAPAPYTLDVYRGTVISENVSGNAAGEVSESCSVPAGTEVTVAANDYSANGYLFSYWDVESGNVAPAPADNVATISFVMPEGNVVITAQYADVNGTAVADPEVAPVPTRVLSTVNSGTASVDGAALALPSEVEVGTKITVTAEDNTAEGYRFTGWVANAIDEAGTETPMDVAMTTDSSDPLTASFEMPDADFTLTATYEPMQYTVTVSGGEIVSTDETPAPASYAAGDRVQIQALAPEGETFTEWTADAGVLDDSFSAVTWLTMPAANVTLTANFTADAAGTVPADDPAAGDPPVGEEQTYTLNVVDGTVTIDGQLITLPAQLKAGTEFTVTAADKTAEGKRVHAWMVATNHDGMSASSMHPGTETVKSFTMPDAATTITIDYRNVYAVTVENGEITGPDTTGLYEKDTVITVTAKDRTSEGLKFSGWTVTSGNTALADASAQTTFTMPEAAVSLSAGYTQIQTEPAPPSVYTVTVSGGVIAATGAVSGSYEAGASVQLQANAAADGMKFSKWSAKTETGETVADSFFSAVNEAASGFTVPASNVVLTAEYAPVKYKVKVNDGLADYKKAAGGTKVTISADEAPAGMEFDCWIVESGNLSLKNASKETTTFTMPYARAEVSASYRKKEYHVTVQNGYSDENTYYMGEQVTICSNYPAAGKEFDKWQSVSGSVSFGDASRWKTTFTMPASDVTVNAVYKDGPSPESNQILDLVAGGEYITDNTIKFTAAGAGMDNTNPNPGDYRYRPTGYQIGNVTGSWQSSPYTTTMSIKARGDYTLKVNYAKDVFDGTSWVPDGTTDTRSVTFRVLTPAEAVATGDETPIVMTIALAGASCLLFLLLLSVFIRRKKNS